MSIDNEGTESVEAPEQDSIRGDIEAALASAEREESVETPAVEAKVEEGTTSLEGDSRRDEKGRFKAAAEAAKVAAAATKGPAPTPGAVTTPPAAVPAGEKAPQSWKATIREKWGTLPPEVQQEVARREREMATSLQEAAESRKLAQAFHQTVAPFAGMIQAEGSDPIKTVGNLLRTAAALRTASPEYKAQLVAQMVQQFAVPVERLGHYLGGGQADPNQPAQGQPYKDPRVDQLLAQLQQAQMSRQQAIVQQNATQLKEFSSKSEFFEEVREIMADLIDGATKRGIPLSLEDAYNRAIHIHPDVAAVVKQRAAVQTVANTQVSTQRSRAAASSVRPQPAAAPRAAQPTGNLREDLEAAWEDVAGR